MTLYVGTSGYAYREWKGSFYPTDLPAARMLRYYGGRFPAVESNSTFKSMPTAAAVRAWAAEVPAGFKFAIKAPEQITHRKRLKGVGRLVTQLFVVADVLKRRLGPVLVQLPPNFKKDVPRLRDFLASVPPRRRVAFEFRNASWFDEEVYGLLRKRRAALCIADADKLTVPFVPTADWGYLRLRRDSYGTAALRTWAKRVGEQSWKDAFVFFKHDDAGRGPAMARQFSELVVR
jgi:uncharacterized protein YecE (DUF72 family)